VQRDAPEIWAGQSVFKKYPAKKAGVFTKYGILADILPFLRTFRE
jgi:hypothetical protein